VLVCWRAPGILERDDPRDHGFLAGSSRCFAGLALALLACHQPAPPASSSGETRPTVSAITHVTLIDPDAGARPDVTIVMAGDLIRQVGPSREILALFGPLAAQAARAGVHLLAGTDIGDPFVVPGFALHDELRLPAANRSGLRGELEVPAGRAVRRVGAWPGGCTSQGSFPPLPKDTRCATLLRWFCSVVR